MKNLLFLKLEDCDRKFFVKFILKIDKISKKNFFHKKINLVNYEYKLVEEPL